MQDVINLALNPSRYTLIKDVSNIAGVGRTHQCTIHEDELDDIDFDDEEWFISEGLKLLNSGKGIATKYGLLFKNEEVPFEQEYTGDNLPPKVFFDHDTHIELIMRVDKKAEMLHLPDDELAIKKAMARLGVKQFDECEFSTATHSTILIDIVNRADKFIANKDIWGLNELLNSEYDPQKKTFRSEVARKLDEMGIKYSDEFTYISIIKDTPDAARIYSNGQIAGHVGYATSDEYSKVKRIARLANEYCKAFANAQPYSAEGLEDKYRCLAEFNEKILAAKYDAEYGFEFVVWDKDPNGNAVYHGNYFGDYEAAKEDFAERSGLINSDRLFSEADMKNLLRCVDFALDNGDDMSYTLFQEIQELKKRIEKVVPEPEQEQDEAPQMSM